MANQKITRELWLERGVAAIAKLYAAQGHTVPAVKVSCSWAGGRGKAYKALGQCWPTRMSDAGINEIFISPAVDEPVQALSILAHELAHAIDDCKNSHRAPFVAIGRSIGMEGKAEQLLPGAALTDLLTVVALRIGMYPHASLNMSERPNKQGTRMLKLECADCTAVWRMSGKWASMATSCPCCQGDNVRMDS